LQLAKGSAAVSLVERGLFSNGAELMIGTAKNSDGRWGEILITPNRMSFTMWQPYSNTYAGGGFWIGVNPYNTAKLAFFIDSIPTYLHGGNDAGVFIYVPSSTTGAGNAVLVRQNNNYYKLCQGTSSSKRYKDVISEMSDEDVEKYYNIQPVFAKFKDKFLDDNDERYRLVHPMFIAENVDEYFPEAVDHNFDGEAENWNYRILIPAMFQMIKSQKKEINSLKKRLENLEQISGGKESNGNQHNQGDNTDAPGGRATF
ncbi:MAG: tail fiber domain-containing protein, partial [Lachnospiraceae bacterium]|nr:tail fiber domain-containing protein [Lachnospiraceae bacterium]